MVGANWPTMYSSTRGTASNPNVQYVPSPLKHVPPQMVSAAATPSSSDVVIDPYARPMAVKDVLPRSSVHVVRATGVQDNGNHGYGRQAPLCQKVLQTNSFMRPRSASLVPLEAVMRDRREGMVPRQVGYQNEAARIPSGQVAGVRGGPSQFRYSTRSLSTQWLNGLPPQSGTIQSGSSGGILGANSRGCMVANSPSQVIQVRYGTSNGYLPTGTPLGVSSVPNSSARESNRSLGANRSLSTGANHVLAGPEPTPNIPSRLEFDDPYPSDSASIRSQRNNRRCEDATSLRNQADRTTTGALLQGVPTKGANSLGALVTQTGATTASSQNSFTNSIPTSVANNTPESNYDAAAQQVRRQVKVDMGIVSALVDKMRNAPKESEESTRSHLESGPHPQKNGSSHIEVSKNELENSDSRTKLAPNPTKPQSGVATKPPSGAALRPDLGLGPRNQLIGQERLKRMPVTNTYTGSPFPTRPLTIQNLQDLSRLSNPRPLPPSPRKRSAVRSSSQKRKTGVENRSHSSSGVDTVEEESLLGNDDTELDSLDDEDGSDDLNGFLSDEESSHGTSYSSPSPTTIQGRARSCSSKFPAKSIARRYHDNEVAARKVSLGSKSAGTRPSPVAMAMLLSDGEDRDPMPSLTDSLFSNIPPTINFVLEGQKVEPLPNEFRKLLKWRMSPITPNVVKQCIARSGFKSTLKSHTWLGYWGKHMKPPGFKTIRDYQKMNHFPGTFQLGRKDRLWRNLSRMQSRFGKKEFDFFPQTYILPGDLASLKAIFEDGSNKNKWIIKPPASARGIGIQVVHKWNEIPKNRPVIVQRYLAHPYLINDSKFDLRIYVYVTSFDPLRIYVYEDGLARFASVKYSYSLKNLHNRFMHLTNYSVNKRNADYESNSDEDICQGHKWSLKALWIYLQSKGIDSGAIWVRIKDLVIKTIISTESIINSMVKANVRRRYSCHELFGFDVLLDEKLKPWVIEVNISPSLHSNSQLDINVKGGMIRDLFNLAGFMIPEKNDVLANPGPAPDLSTYEPSNDVCLDRRLWTNQKSPDEKAKHLYYTQRHSDEQVQATILDVLTPDDIRILTETIDENSRRGDFQRVFPSASARPYHALFEQQRYYNLLLHAWCTKYPTTETRGISLLESYCRKGIHLENPTSKTKHQWVPPTLNSFTKEMKNTGSPPTASQPSLSESPYAR